MPAKSDHSIQQVALAAIRRHGVDIGSWRYTAVGEKALIAHVQLQETELPILRVLMDEANWTQITTRRIIGVTSGQLIELDVNQLDDYIIGLPSGMTQDFGLFRTTDFYGVHNDFIMEAGYARQAVTEALGFLLRSVRAGS